MSKPAIFIDRDGTLVEEVNYLSRIADLRVFPFTAPALRMLKDKGFALVVLTNQSGIGRGIYTVDDMHAIHEAIQLEVGGIIDGFYFCPHLPDGDCECRKPGLGMIEAAVRDHDIDLRGSWMIGDKDLDVMAAQNAEIGSAMVMTGYGREHLETLSVKPDIVAEHFGEAAERIAAVS